MTQRIAGYGYWDLVNGDRIHCWMTNPPKYAIGQGPLRDITKDEAVRLLNKDDADRVARGMKPRGAAS